MRTLINELGYFPSVPSSLVGAYFLQPQTHVPDFNSDLPFDDTCSLTGGSMPYWGRGQKRKRYTNSITSKVIKNLLLFSSTVLFSLLLQNFFHFCVMPFFLQHALVSGGCKSYASNKLGGRSGQDLGMLINFAKQIGFKKSICEQISWPQKRLF